MSEQPSGCNDCSPLKILKWTKDGNNTFSEAQYPVQRRDTVFSLADWDFVLIFASANEIGVCSRGCKERLSSEFAIPNIWWDECYRKAIGYFGREDSVDARGIVTGISTWSRFTTKIIEPQKTPQEEPRYHWRKFNIFTRWITDSRQAIIFFDPRPEVKRAIKRRFLGEAKAKLLPDPLWAYSVIGQEVLASQHEAVWIMRGLVRHKEKNRAGNDQGTDFPRLHDLARHAIHISETVDLCTLTLDEIVSHHKQDWTTMPKSERSPHDKVIRAGEDAGAKGKIDAAAAAADDDDNDDNDDGSPQGTPTPPSATRAVRHRLLFHRNALRSMLFRAAANRERLQNEISLAFNTVAQRDARTSVDISRATREDGVAMKTIAFVTLVFLPGTFICAVFSMSFFNFSPETDRWVVSDKFWIYWAVTVPVTVGTAVVFAWWSRPKPKSADGKASAGAVSLLVEDVLATFRLQRMQRKDTEIRPEA